MAKFYVCTNEGVTGVMPEPMYRQHEEAIEAIRRDGMDAVMRRMKELGPVRPTFTFSDYPALRAWMTGTDDDMEELLHGHAVETGKFYVPFSRHRQWAVNHIEAQKEEAYRTTYQDLKTWFGVRPHPELVTVVADCGPNEPSLVSRLGYRPRAIGPAMAVWEPLGLNAEGFQVQGRRMTCAEEYEEASRRG